MVKFVGSPLTIPAAVGTLDAIQKTYVDAADTLLDGRVTVLEAGGGLTFVDVSGAYTASIGDFVLADATAAAFTVTLPAAPPTNTRIGVKKVDSGTNIVTVVGSGGTTIDGDAEVFLAASQAAMDAMFDGTNWVIVSIVTYDTGSYPEFTYRGDYSASTGYLLNDVVYYDGSSYIALLANSGVAPTPGVSSATWGLMALEGEKGDPGAAGGVAVGTTTTGVPGTNADVVNTGTASAAVLEFTIPRGDAGTPATVAVATTTTGAPGSSATVVNTGTASAAVLEFTIPRGDVGPSGLATTDVVTKAASWTLTPADRILVMNSAGATTVTLPSSIQGALYTVKNIGTGVVTMASTSAQTIDTAVASSVTILQWGARTFVGHNGNWLMV